MFLLDWRLALFALALLPFFVLLTRRVGNERRRIATTTPGDAGRHLEPRPGVAVGLRDPARQDDGPRRRARRPLRGASRARLADLEVRQRMAGRWVMASIQMTLRGHAGRRLLVRRARARARLERGLDRHARRVHDAADAALLPGRVAARRRRRRADLARALRPRSSSTSTCRSTSTEKPDALDRRRRRGDVAFEHVWFRYGERAGRSQDVVVRRSRRARRPRSSARPARARRRSATSSARLYDVERGRGHDRRRRRPRPELRVARRPRRRRLAGDLPLPRLGAREPALREARRDRRGDRGGRRAPRRSTT